MCFPDLLCQTNDGEVFVSRCKNHYKVGFFHLVMVYNQADFINLYQSLNSCLGELGFEPNQDVKSIIFSTPLKAMRLRFSPKDIKQLHYLVESSCLQAGLYLNAAHELAPKQG